MALKYTVKHANTVTGDLAFAGGIVIPYAGQVVVYNELPPQIMEAYRNGLVTITDGSTGVDIGYVLIDSAAGTASGTGNLETVDSYAKCNNNFSTIVARHNAMAKQLALLAGQIQGLVAADKAPQY